MESGVEAMVQRLCDEAQISFVRASGPGGQNVNKVATAVQLRFDIDGCGLLSEHVKARLRRLGGRRVNGEGVLQIAAQRLRTQEGNRRDALRRLADLIRSALPEPRKRVATRPTAASRRRRIEGKRVRSLLKTQRKAVGGED